MATNPTQSKALAPQERPRTIWDLLPPQFSKIRSKMSMISGASLLDPQELQGEYKITVELDRIIREPITIRCFSSNSYSAYHHTLLICNTINEIFVGRSTSDNDAVRLFIQAMVLIFGRGVLNSIRVAQLLDFANLSLEIDTIDVNDENAIKELEEDEETVECMQRAGVKTMPNPQVVMTAYCGAILLLAGKQITEASVITWTGRRIRGLAASMKSSVELASVVPFNVQACLRVYQKLSMFVPLRAFMVRVLFDTTGNGTPIASLSTAMLNLLAWSEMTHIKMIQEYIFGRFPELLVLKQLQSTLGVLEAAWDFLYRLDERERPYAKLLYGPQQTKALQRKHFILFIDAAHAVASYLHSSFVNYQGDTQGTAGAAIKKIVWDYLHTLERNGQLVIQAAQYTTMDKRAIENVLKAELLFQQQLNDLDAEVKALMRE